MSKFKSKKTTKETALLKPLLVPQRNFEVIRNFFVDKSPQMKCVFMSVGQYSLNESIVSSKRIEEIPTHFLVFCVRTVACNQYQPLAVLQIDERKNQSEKIAIVWRAFIQDLSAMGLEVIASISPCNDVFKKVLKTLTKVLPPNQGEKPIFYSSYPYNEILHFFDPVSLMDQFQEFFSLSVDIYFATPLGPNEEPVPDYRLGVASWNDILAAMAMADIECSYTRPCNGIAENNYKVFSNSEFRSTYQRISLECYDNLQSDTKLYSDRVMTIIDHYSESYRPINDVIWSLNDLQNVIDDQEELRLLLFSLRFSNKHTQKIFQRNQLAVDDMDDLVYFPTSARHLYEVHEKSDASSLWSQSSMELDEKQIDRLIRDIDNSIDESYLNERLFNFMMPDSNRDKKKKKRKKSSKSSDFNNIDLFVNFEKNDEQPQELKDKWNRLRQVMSLEKEEREQFMKNLGFHSDELEKDMIQVMEWMSEQKKVEKLVSTRKSKKSEKNRSSKDSGRQESGYGTDRETETKHDKKANHSEMIPSMNSLGNSLVNVLKSYAGLTEKELEPNYIHSPSFLSNHGSTESLADLTDCTYLPRKHVIINVAQPEEHDIPNLTQTSEENLSGVLGDPQLGDLESPILHNLKMAIDTLIETGIKHKSMNLFDTNKIDDDRYSSDTYKMSVENEDTGDSSRACSAELEKRQEMGTLINRSFTDAVQLIQDDVEKLQITNDWLSTLVGHTTLKDILIKHEISHLTWEIFTLRHIDHFVSRIKNPNEMYRQGNVQLIGDPLNFPESWSMVLDGSGVYIII